uniref:Uncharacterized protein n=1 Tax=Anguilla anguilla TaxID=7936 RepID=A0A0E9XPL3_ANGAN
MRHTGSPICFACGPAEGTWQRRWSNFGFVKEEMLNFYSFERYFIGYCCSQGGFQCTVSVPEL